MSAAQLHLAGFVFPAVVRRRRWAPRPSWVQQPLCVGGVPLLEWAPPGQPPQRRAKILHLPSPAPKPAAPPVARDLFAEWEKRLAAEGMPAELVVDMERPKALSTIDFLGAPGGGCRPLMAARAADSEGNREEHGKSRGAWWLSEVRDDDGTAKWDRLNDEVRVVVERAIHDAEKLVPGAVLTAKQATVLRLYFEGLRQTEIAQQERHSKVTVWHKLRRAFAAIGSILRASGLTIGQ